MSIVLQSWIEIFARASETDDQNAAILSHQNRSRSSIEKHYIAGDYSLLTGSDEGQNLKK
jgi:hypothetical protein